MSIERLKEYLGALPPGAQALLMREFERSIERGDDPTIANFVLSELRKIVRAPSEDLTARTDDPMRLVFRPLERFLVDSVPSVRPGQIRRASLGPIWIWLGNEGIPDKLRAFEDFCKSPSDSNTREQATREVQAAAAEAIAQATGAGPSDSSARQRPMARFGSTSVSEDIVSVGAVLSVRDALDTLNSKLPGQMRTFAESQIKSVMGSMNIPALQTPQTLPFALSLVMPRLPAPWQIIRLGISVAASDDELRVAGTPFGVTVTMAIHDMAQLVTALRSDLKRGHSQDLSNHLKALHDGMRGLRTELDIRTDSGWGRQLTAIRSEISNSLHSEIDSVPGKVRRLLRQGPDKEVTANSKVDPVDVEAVAALIDFVAICRNYAGELAINEASLRSYSELQQYVETATQTLMESLRAPDPKIRAYRLMQMQAAIRFCDVMFGPDYASLMRRAADMVKPVEKKEAKAG
ncbi:hypothetical protein [Bradyrhizobium sp. SYSU BS000235]|uniref:hypothetical protein n=1 Tax=Bradyrhizobium sp. SYSU BS000235 TaxID=3411332 RepID=UPI003C71723E